MSLEKRPLTDEELEPQVRKVAGSQAPAKLKGMVAKGLAPGLAAGQLITALYQLTFDESSAVAQTARQSFMDLPESVITGAVEQPLHPLVLDRLAKAIVGWPKLVTKLILNRAVANETLVDITPKLNEAELELLAKNEQRLLSHPALIEALYLNPNTRMSTANRAVELAVRNKVELSLPAYREMAKAIGMEKKEADPIDQALIEEERNVKFSEAYRHGQDKGIDDVAELSEAEAEEERARQEKHKQGRQKLSELTVPEKIRLATMGNIFHRAQLMHDSNKMVAMAAIKSPLVSEIEVVRISKSPSIPEDVLRYIARQRDWLKHHQVKANLVSNSKTPLAISLKLVSHLRKKELQQLSRSKNIPAALRNAAGARLKKAKR